MADTQARSPYMYTPGHSRLISTGVYIPAQRITSREIMEQFDSLERFGVPADWLERITGIKEKRVTPEGILPSDMATRAAQEAMETAGILPDALDAIIYAGVTRDHLEPATAHIVQAKIKAHGAMVFDISNACHGFMNGIHLMDALIATGQARRGLVVSGEQGSLFTRMAIEALTHSYERRSLTEFAAGLTLGDAGAAVILGPKLAPGTGFMGFMLHSQGQFAGLCRSGALLQEGPVYTDMPTIVSESTKLIIEMYESFMHKRLKWRKEDLAKCVVHQVGIKTFRLYREKLGIPLDLMPDTVTTLGNLITATIPVNIHNVLKSKEINSAQKIYLSGVGSGISLSQAGLVWDAA